MGTNKRIQCKTEDCVGSGYKVKGKTYFVKGLCTKCYQELWRNGCYHALKKSNRILEKRHAIIEGEIAKIPLGKGAEYGYAIVDKEFAFLDKYNWGVSGGYARRYEIRRPIFMHHMIIGKPQNGLVTDHINRNILDNRASNLRHVNRSINNINSKLCKNNKSGYRGVRRHRASSKRFASISVNGQRIPLGYFISIGEAIDARKKAEQIYHIF